MAAAVENNTRYTDYWGKTPVEIVDVTWNNGDTFASQWAAIVAADFTPTTSASYGLTISGNVVTLASGGALTGKLEVKGSGE